ncbi:bactofilin family protein [Sphingomonas sp. DT-207]|uniref:bactofilin family protein n=1 Tax=Sphingomonas sp. DT-207 TaxID=3396167 RepID=UPI003F19F86D
MLNNRNARKERPAAPVPSQDRGRARGPFSVLGPEVAVTGNVATPADLHIEGRVDGDVTGGNVTQGKDSLICGNLTADTARLAGRIEGMVRVRTLTIENSARIVGDVEYESITIETGGSIDGRMKHVGAMDAAAQPGPRAVAAVNLAAATDQAA